MKPRISSPTKNVRNQEALKTCELVSQFPNLVDDEVNDLLANGVMSAGIVIGSIFIACDELLWIEELAVGIGADFISVGFRSINTALGTFWPAPVSLKKVLKESSPHFLSLGIWPSG